MGARLFKRDERMSPRFGLPVLRQPDCGVDPGDQTQRSDQ
jgi:hypothetical protein